MFLKSMDIENFLIFRERQTIPFAPFTILIGKNGAGKSTVHSALGLLCALKHGMPVSGRLDGKFSIKIEWTKPSAAQAIEVSYLVDADQEKENLDINEIVVFSEDDGCTFSRLNPNEKIAREFRLLPFEETALVLSGNIPVPNFAQIEVESCPSEPIELFQSAAIQLDNLLNRFVVNNTPDLIFANLQDLEIFNRLLGRFVNYRLVKKPGAKQYVFIDVWGNSYDEFTIGEGIRYLAYHLKYLACNFSEHVLIFNHPDAVLHPSLHGVFADICSEAAGRNNQIILETHSEHLILRLQKRIRGGLLNPNTVMLLHVNNGKVTPIHFDEEGDLADEVPGGFFHERLEELR